MTNENQVQNKESAIKHDQGKAGIALIDPDFMTGIAQVLDFGAKKYDADNWRKGFNYRRTLSATFRHLFEFLKGIDNDPETGLSHLYHAACNLMFLAYFVRKGKGIDDRQD